MNTTKPTSTAPDRHEASRKAFEDIISGSPFELPVTRYPDDPTHYAWPANYTCYKVQLAWDVYRALDHAAQEATCPECIRGAVPMYDGDGNEIGLGRCELCDGKGFNPSATPPEPTPPSPDGSAVEWVKERLYKANGRNLVLDENDALELARRCDAAEAHNKSLAKMLATTLIERDQARTMFRNHNDQLADEQNQFGLLKGELHTTKAKLAAAERRVERLREELWNIVNANPRQWGDQADQFEAWAKNRARAALAETKEGASNE